MMAGFGAAKRIQEDREESGETLPNIENKTTPVVNSNDPFSDLRNELQSLHKNQPKTTVFALIAGHENTGKTAIVLDAFDRHCKNDSNGKDQLWILDFDGGGVGTTTAFHSNNDRIRCWNPWVMQTGNRTAYDYPGTHDRVMNIMQFAVDTARKQNDAGYDGERIWGLLVTGIDLWDSIAINNMRIIDLNLARDGIESADWNLKVGHQWDWAIRKTRFHQLTALSKQLVSAGCQVYWETHLRMTNYSFGKNEDGAKWRPDCEKSTNNYVYQILMCERVDTYDDERREIIKSEYTVTFDKSKTNAELQGQRRTILVTETGKPARWVGLPELSDGSL